VAKAQRDLLADAPNLECAAVTDTSQPKLGPKDFEILRVVGQGAFGKVGGWGGGAVTGADAELAIWAVSMDTITFCL